MRVALVGPYPCDPAEPIGGVEAWLANLVDGLALLDGVELHVLTFVPGLREPSRDKRGPVSVVYLPGPTRFNNLTLYRHSRRVLRRMIESLEPDIVHAQEASGYGFVTLRAVRHIPVALTIQGVVREELKYETRLYDRLRMGLAGVQIQQYSIRHARYLLQTSRYPEEYFSDLIRGKSVEVGIPVNDRFFETDPAPESATLLYAGGVTPGKRVIDLVDMVATVRLQVPEARLRIAGHTADTAYVASVRARARELGVEDHVMLLGALSRVDLIKEYLHASLFVLASGQENGPMVIAEAMASGVPVVATRVGAVHTLVEHGTTGFLVKVGDITDLGQRVSSLLLDPHKRLAFAAAARTIAETRFRTSLVAERVLEAYRQMRLGTGLAEVDDSS